MRPRIAFATLLALGAAMHLVLLVKPPRNGYLAFYLCWLLPGAAFAWFLSARSPAPRPLSARERRIRRAPSGLWMEGLGLFVGIATLGLVIHLFGPYQTYRGSPAKSAWTQGSVMSLMFFLCAGGCWGLLRGAPGDTAAPIPDGSMLVRAGGWLRRLAGIAIGCWGAWLLVLGIRHWGQSSDGIDRMLNLAFVVGGPLFVLIGLSLALRRGRSSS